MKLIIFVIAFSFIAGWVYGQTALERQIEEKCVDYWNAIYETNR